MEPLEVDGSLGEGGGQVLRMSLLFSVLMNRPIRVSKIRAGREVPGLKRQHLSALRVFAEVFGGELDGAAEGSTLVTFRPGERSKQNYSIDTGTAASITLILQAIVPAAALSKHELALELVGGTDVPWSPTLDHFEQVVGRAYRQVGIEFGMRTARRGYYPKGGGKVMVEVKPSSSVAPLQLRGPSSIQEAKIVSRCANLPIHVAERQSDAARKALNDAGIAEIRTELCQEDAMSPGSSVLAASTRPEVLVGADAIGARGKPAEEVGREAAMNFIEAVRAGATIDTNTADMILPLLSLASSKSVVRVPRVSPHLETGLMVAKMFTDCEHDFLEENRGWVVSVLPAERNEVSRHNV